MRYTKTPIDGVFVLDVEKFEDSRGFFANLYEANEAKSHGLAMNTVQIKLSYNVKKGTVRGMHMQLPPAAECKLVRCVRGSVHDVIVDLRESSPTYRKHFAVELSAENRRALYVPKMFAHGYQTLSDDAEVMYQVDEFYSPKNELGLRYDDPLLGINWPLAVTDISPKDAAWPLLEHVKILYHYHRDFPADVDHPAAGIDKAVAGLAGGLCAVDPNLHCTVSREGPRAIERKHPAGFHIRCFDNTQSKNRSFALAPSLREFIADDMQSGLVVLHAMFNPSVFMMSRALLKRRMQYIVAPHDPYHPTLFAAGRLKKSIYWNCFERPMLRRAVAVQLLDRRHEQYLRARGVNTPVIEVGNGFSPDEVPDESSLAWSEDGPIRILFLGRLDPVNKGIDLLIDAFAQIAPKIPQLKLILQGPDRGEGDIVRQRIESHALRERVEILQPDFQTKASELAGRCDLFILPSRFEGFGLSAMEAMLAGRPVIVSDIAGLAPHVRKSEGGVVVDATVDSIRAGIEQLLSQRPQWRDIGLRGRDYVLRNLGWNSIAANALGDYRALSV